MSYIDFDRLEQIDAQEFQQQKAFPWINPFGVLTDPGYWELVEAMPDVSLFEPEFGRERRFGQQSHDRFCLEYRTGLPISRPWSKFVDELRSRRYEAFLKRMFGRGSFTLRFHWHYASRGGSVSPHCDAARKLGSHLFYMNSSRDWKPEWGGQTVVLDDERRLSHRGSPKFEDFGSSITATCQDNMSFLFRRTEHSWHGVREIECPEDAMRKVFIVVIDDWRLIRRLRSGSNKRDVERY